MYTFIINPHSRSGKGHTIWQAVEAQLKQRQICYTPFFTKYQKHATSYVRKLTSDGSSHILVVLGGDGTLNEVLNGICFPEQVTLGYIPTGSSNDFARSFRIPNDPLRALEIILNPGRTVRMDVGAMSYEGKHRRFAVSTGIGFDAAICHEAVVSKWKRILNRIHLGKFTYAIIALHCLLLTSTCPFHIVLDDEKEISFPKGWFAAVMNHPCEGGGFYFCPDARPDDGQLDVLVVSGLNAPALLFTLPFALFGKHKKFRGVHLFRCRKVSIRTENALPVHTDGEPVFLQRQFTASIEDHPVKVIVS